MVAVERLVAAQSDDELMARVARRDGDAFRLLADNYGHGPFRIGCRMLADPAEAEDIAQEAMLRLWDHADRWKPGSSGVAAWLSRVAMNLCFDRLRRRKFASDEEVPEKSDEGPLADARIEEEEKRVAVVDCITALPPRQRASIVLTYYEELPNKEAAEMLDMRLKAFESLLFRARASLRGCVEGKGVVDSGSDNAKGISP